MITLQSCKQCGRRCSWEVAWKQFVGQSWTHRKCRQCFRFVPGRHCHNNKFDGLYRSSVDARAYTVTTFHWSSNFPRVHLALGNMRLSFHLIPSSCWAYRLNLAHRSPLALTPSPSANVYHCSRLHHCQDHLQPNADRLNDHVKLNRLLSWWCSFEGIRSTPR